ncbi:MAG TPA: translation elongation factor 4 [Patescibacteria group bacterium]|nr:translation elongation factor 4 [Patescibacteria group bacterium]
MDQKHIRNFAIIAHIDHGKSTLSDRFLEITQTIRKDVLGKQEQFLDQNPISRERGITIKLAPVRMHYRYNNEEYQLNLIDTPGHVDFSYEVSRTLAACEGVVLLVDATKGVQAQTVAHFRAAQKEGLTILPAINKIDMDGAEVEKTVKQLESMGFVASEILFISAKTGENVERLLQEVIEKIPPPSGNTQATLRALIFDAVYDEHRGVVSFVRIVDGEITTNQSIYLIQTSTKTNAIDVGYFAPTLVPSGKLTTGQIGYIVTGVKDIRLCRVGDTITLQNAKVDALSGYTTPKPMVFFGVYPKSTDELVALKEGLTKLALIDASLTFHEEYSAFLGSGFRVGFLGLLHADIFKQRLSREFGIEPLFTLPHVQYEKNELGGYKEPYMHLSVHVPQQYLGAVMTVCQKRRGSLLHMEYQDSNVILEYDMPYSMFIRGLSSDLKSVTAGFASIDYELEDYRDAALVELEMRINDNPIDVLSEFVYKDEADYVARDKIEKLKESLPRQQYRQILQCMINERVLARGEISPYRKDVLQKMSGGDRTRKDKLLEAQKKGKSKMLSISKVEIPQQALFDMITSE